MTDLVVYAGLFAAAFLAATVVPAQSEAILTGLVLRGDQALWALITVASLGNVLGATVNWGLGRGLERFHDRKWFPLKGPALDRTRGWYSRYGRWSLLLSWVPFIGDPLTVVAGVMRESLGVFLVFVSIGKVGRYLALAMMVTKIAG